jgi:hypothetical protein
MDRLITWLSRVFCSHVAVKLETTGPALVSKGSVVLPGVQITCTKCGEFWHAEIDASEAMRAGLGE